MGPIYIAMKLEVFQDLRERWQEIFKGLIVWMRVLFLDFD
jgi:hypothetical protein